MTATDPYRGSDRIEGRLRALELAVDSLESRVDALDPEPAPSEVTRRVHYRMTALVVILLCAIIAGSVVAHAYITRPQTVCPDSQALLDAALWIQAEERDR